MEKGQNTEDRGQSTPYAELTLSDSGLGKLQTIFYFFLSLSLPLNSI